MCPQRRTNQPGVVDVSAKLAELDERLTRLEAGPPIPQRRLRDADDLRVFRAVVRTIGAARFLTPHVIAHAREANPDLLAVLTSADCDSARSLGRLLRRVEGRVIDGVLLVRIAASSVGVIWKIERA